MEVVKSENKQKVDQIDNEVMLSLVVNTKNKTQNDEIINNSVSNEQQSQQQKKGKNSNKKKKNKQKNSHNNDKGGGGGDDELNKKQIKSKQVKEEEEEAELAITITNCTDNKHEQSVSQKEEEDLPLNKPFIATLEPLTITITTPLVNDDNNADNDNTTMYCPLTPRHIVDVEADVTEPKQIYDLKKSTTINSISKEEAAALSRDNHVQSDADDEYYDADDDDNEDGDNGLLVQFLDEANRIAEAKLAQRRQARVEAREIRMRELERQQQQQEQNADRVFDMHTNSSGVGDALSRTRLTAGMATLSINSVLNATRANSMCSRRSSEDSLEEEGRSLRDIRHELKDVEERFRKAMIANAQLDNERASQTYQIQLLKDKLEEMEESYAQLQREFKDKSRESNAFKRQLDKITEELKLVQGQLNERDTLIAEQGLVIVAVENEDGSDARRALVTVENAQLLGTVQGSLDVRLKKFSEEKQQLMAEVQRLQDQLENYKSHGKQRGMANGPLSDDEYEAQREANKIILDYKYKLQKAEQEIASLQSSLARSETQVIRYKSTAEAAEKAEAELKIERRKLQREEMLIMYYWDECHCQ